MREMMQRNIRAAVRTGGSAALAALLLAGCVEQPVRTMAGPPPRPQRLFVYPSRGQSPEQQDRDRYDCHVWAVKQTGVDPSQASAGPYERVVVQPAPGAATFAGAVGGAIVGSMIGGDDNSGVGALLGGVAGAMIGSAADANAAAQARLTREQIATERANADSYRRAITACLSARGYTVR
ncbi:MAG: glycine zipper 2TM domain-containing protein [Gammaproteobacteria bacterium]|nr:glycine zipper 2TM domain-containing protein [Gammaproteobacteria bacterium]